MSDSADHSARPVSVVTTLAIVALCGLFLLVVCRFYQPATAAPQNSQAENLPADLAWKATPATRRAALNELRAAQQKQAATYAWADKNAGVVQLPIERAMQLTAEKYGAKK
ncbi:MAG: hypothetical protein RLZZ15_2805 [Verrucomicrobiota bacterium]|jgi:hypothetical protein